MNARISTSKSALVGVFLLWSFFALTLSPSQAAQTVEIDDALLADLVKKTYAYAFPVYEMYRMRQGDVYAPDNPNRTDLNQFNHKRKLSDHADRWVNAPNNDTLYSNAWLDLSQEPVVLSVPDSGGRYYSMAFMDFYTNNFAYVGRRTTGTKAGNYVVVGPKWIGTAPAGLRVIKSPTNAVWLLGRTLVDDDTDLVNLKKFQDQCRLTPLSVWTKTGEVKVKTDVKNPPPAPDPKDPWNFFKIVNLGLTENPPPADEASLMAEFAKIGVGPNQTFDPSRFSEEQRKVVLAAMQDAAKGIPMGLADLFKLLKEGWLYSNPNLGNYGKDYSLRARTVLTGIGALELVEAAYFTAVTDKTGKPFSGKNRYRLHFEKGALPPVDGFWSLSMYEVTPDRKAFFVDNPIHRYSIGDRTKGLRLNNDGSLDIYIQNQSPGMEMESNWLPAPPGPLVLVFRTYQPQEAILKGDYALPGIQRVE
jgi:hypothetical protein